MNDTTRRILRSLLQIIGGGGAGALFMQLAKDVPDAYAPYVVMLGSTTAMCAQLVYEELRGKDVLIGRSDKPKGKGDGDANR